MKEFLEKLTILRPKSEIRILNDKLELTLKF